MNDESPRPRFGELVALRREAVQWTRRRLAAALGVSVVTVSNLERGRRVSAETLRRVAGLAELGLQSEAEVEASAGAPAPAPPASLNLRQAGRDLVFKALASEGSKAAAAAALGVSRRTVYNLLERYAEDDAAAAAALAAGASAADVARDLRTTPKVVQAAARDAGVKQRRGRRERTPGSTRKTLAALRVGKPRAEVAAAAGCTLSGVDKLARRLASEDAEALRVTLVGQVVEVHARNGSLRATGVCALRYEPRIRCATAEVAGQRFSFALPWTSPPAGDVHRLGDWTFKVRRDEPARLAGRLQAEAGRRRELAAEARAEAARQGVHLDVTPDEAVAEFCEREVAWILRSTP